MHLAPLRLAALRVVLLAACAPAAVVERPMSTRPAPPRTLVAVVAHPDDETLVAPVLARYAREGARVHLVIATDGRLGAAAWTGIPAGDSLATVRAAEARCSARALGAQPPILLGFPDAALADFSGWPGRRLDTLVVRLDSVFRALRPDAVITWGPEGGYGHADHRLTGLAVTQVFQGGGIAPSVPLFYPGFPAVRTDSAPRWYGQRLHAVAPALLTARIAITAADREAAWRSIACHWSQATAEQQARNRDALDFLWRGTVTFQQWRGGTARATLF